MEQETKLPQWKHWIGYHERISHDAFGYASNRMNPEQLRRAGVFINKKGRGLISGAWRNRRANRNDPHRPMAKLCRALHMTEDSLSEFFVWNVSPYSRKANGYVQ